MYKDVESEPRRPRTRNSQGSKKRHQSGQSCPRVRTIFSWSRLESRRSTMTYVPSTARCVIGVLLYTVGLLGCATEASLERDTSTGGLVTFPLETESDILESAGRRDALQIMDAKCRSGW